MRMLQDASDEKIVRLYGVQKDAIVPLRRRLESMLKHGMEHTIDHIVKIRDERNQQRVLKGQWLPATASYMKYRIETIFKNVPEWIFQDYKYEDDSVCTFTLYCIKKIIRLTTKKNQHRYPSKTRRRGVLLSASVRFNLSSNIQSYTHTHTHKQIRMPGLRC